MHLKRESRTVRWAYLWEARVPQRTSLCAIFWRTVLVTPLKMLTPLSILLLLLTMAIAKPLEFGIVVGIIAVTAVIVWLQQRSPPPSSQPSVIRDGFRAVKSKVCPIVDIS